MTATGTATQEGAIKEVERTTLVSRICKKCADEMRQAREKCNEQLEEQGQAIERYREALKLIPEIEETRDFIDSEIEEYLSIQGECIDLDTTSLLDAVYSNMPTVYNDIWLNSNPNFDITNNARNGVVVEAVNKYQSEQISYLEFIDELYSVMPMWHSSDTNENKGVNDSTQPQAQNIGTWEQVANVMTIGDDTRKLLIAHGKITDAMCLVSEVIGEYTANPDERLQDMTNSVDDIQREIVYFMSEIMGDNISWLHNAKI